MFAPWESAVLDPVATGLIFSQVCVTNEQPQKSMGQSLTKIPKDIVMIWPASSSVIMRLSLDEILHVISSFIVKCQRMGNSSFTLAYTNQITMDSLAKMFG